MVRNFLDGLNFFFNSFCFLLLKLFKKELYKNIGWLDKKEVILLKIWALATFTQYKKTILDVYDQAI